MMGELRGVHVAGIFGAGFAVIIGANAILAVNAVRTFPGLETKNSYIASQTFDAERRAQEALGWDVSAAIEGGTLRLEIAAGGDVAAPQAVTAVLGRPSYDAADRTLDLQRGDGAAFLADVGDLPLGIWRLRLTAEAPNGIAFRQDLDLRNRR